MILLLGNFYKGEMEFQINVVKLVKLFGKISEFHITLYIIIYSRKNKMLSAKSKIMKIME